MQNFHWDIDTRITFNQLQEDGCQEHYSSIYIIYTTHIHEYHSLLQFWYYFFASILGICLLSFLIALFIHSYFFLIIAIVASLSLFKAMSFLLLFTFALIIDNHCDSWKSDTNIK